MELLTFQVHVRIHSHRPPLMLNHSYTCSGVRWKRILLPDDLYRSLNTLTSDLI